MEQRTKKIVAREWLIFIAILLVGLILTPAIFFHTYTVPMYGTRTNTFDFTGIEMKATRPVGVVEQFADHLFARWYWLQTWATVLCPYVIFLFARSLYWALRAIRY
jgi:hypothetical protein